jgi:hypothetical protein
MSKTVHPYGRFDIHVTVDRREKGMVGEGAWDVFACAVRRQDGGPADYNFWGSNTFTSEAAAIAHALNDVKKWVDSQLN